MFIELSNTPIILPQFNMELFMSDLSGLGIESATLLAPSAHMASAVVCRQTSMMILLEPLNEPHATFIWFEISHCTETQENAHLQKSWTRPCHKEQLKTLKLSSNDEAKTRISACEGKHSWVWLNALPSANLGLKFTNLQLKIIVAWRLGAKVCEPHTCVCGTAVSTQETHALSCVKSSGRFSRHTVLKILFKQALGTVHVPSVLEPPGLCDQDWKRPDWMTTSTWSRGFCLIWDITVVDSPSPAWLASGLSETATLTADDKKEESTTS